MALTTFREGIEVMAAAHVESRNLLNQFVTTQVLVPIVRTAGFDHFSPPASTGAPGQG